jgi:hypothetical protein
MHVALKACELLNLLEGIFIASSTPVGRAMTTYRASTSRIGVKRKSSSKRRNLPSMACNRR